MDTKSFVDELQAAGVGFFCGVPDSLLKNFCLEISTRCDARHHVIAANEGNAIGLACGHYLATGRPGAVYMQNSGQGNAVNPLLSLADPDVYSIPLLLIVGWRGEPGVKDEPQHVKQGKATISLFNTMGIACEVLPTEDEAARRALQKAVQYMQEHKKPYALIVRKGTFGPIGKSLPEGKPFAMTREQAICTIAAALPQKAVVVSTTGMISRELYEYRCRGGQGHGRDFLTVGSMGHASSIAMGIAMAQPQRPVVCLDGDGACLMHLGALPIVAAAGMQNFKHIVLNNEAHDSVGGQPTVGGNISYARLAQDCGYTAVLHVETAEELAAALPSFFATPGTCLLEVKVRKGARADLGRPKESPQQNKAAFMEFLAQH